jgi:hypothetical protein
MFFVRRDGRVKGPLTRERLRELRREDRLRMRDEIALAADGPWSRLRDVSDDVLADEESVAADDEFWREELPPDKPPPAPRKAAANDDDSRSWFERLRESIEGDGAFRQPFHLWSFLAAAVPLAAVAAFFAVILVSPALEPARQPPPPAGPVTGADAGADANADADVSAGTPADGTAAAAPADLGAAASAQAVVPGRISAMDPAHDAAVTALLAAYYAAGDWQSRYRLVVPGERTRRLIQQMHAEQGTAAGDHASRWSLATRLEPGKLAAAARSGQPVLVETSVDDHSHAVYVVFVEDRWRVDWLRSLETLWLTR